MSIQFTPVEPGDMSEILPDAPAGEWVASFRTKLQPTSKDKYPMIIVDAKLEEALTPGNEFAVHKKVSDFIVFFPKDHNATKMARLRLHALCAALKIEIPKFPDGIRSDAEGPPAI